MPRRPAKSRRNGLSATPAKPQELHPIQHLANYACDPDHYNEPDPAQAAAIVSDFDALASTLNAAGQLPWVHNAAHTTDIEALRRICLAYSTWWNDKALPILARI